MSILICVPTYNEEESVKQVIQQLRDAGLDFIICDGFSTDNTVSIANQENAEVLLRKKVGKGYAINQCLNVAEERGYEFMGIIDCDSTYSVKELKELYQLAEKENYDMVVGGRPFDQIAIHRRWANYFISAYFNFLFHSSVTDIVSGSRILRVKSFNNKVEADSFDLEPRLLAYSIKNKMNIIQIPISYKERLGESKANLVELYKILWGMTHERIRS